MTVAGRAHRLHEMLPSSLPRLLMDTLTYNSAQLKHGGVRSDRLHAALHPTMTSQEVMSAILRSLRHLLYVPVMPQ